MTKSNEDETIRLYEEVVTQMELWANRAEYWRRVALLFADGRWQP
jgi:hypothetical protein